MALANLDKSLTDSHIGLYRSVISQNASDILDQRRTAARAAMASKSGNPAPLHLNGEMHISSSA